MTNWNTQRELGRGVEIKVDRSDSNWRMAVFDSGERVTPVTNINNAKAVKWAAKAYLAAKVEFKDDKKDH